MNKQITLAQLRYNTESSGNDYCWRLVLDGEELLVQSVQINAPSFTSKNWVEHISTFKHHISVSNCYVAIDEKDNAIITSSSA